MHLHGPRAVRAGVPGVGRREAPGDGHRRGVLREADFEAIGDYREGCRWGEDVWFLFDLMRRGWRTGRRLEGATTAPAVLSARKFDRYGDWHYFTMPFRIAWDAVRRRDTTTRQYWYERR